MSQPVQHRPWNWFAAFVLGIAFSLAPVAPSAQTPAAGVPPAQPGCCGAITARGQSLARFLDTLDVESKWLAHSYVNWETGEPDRIGKPLTPGSHTHCSAFAASTAKRLGVYLLRPPEHSATLLANAQAEWLPGKDAQKAGWLPAASMHDAQQHANQGDLVVAVYANPDPKKPGHVAIVRPAVLTEAELAQNGPAEIQAGLENFKSSNIRTGFRHHPGAFPADIRYYFHSLPSLPQ